MGGKQTKNLMSTADEELDFGGIFDDAAEIAEFGLTEKPRLVDALDISRIKAISGVQTRKEFDPANDRTDAEFLESIKAEGGNHEPIWVVLLEGAEEAYKLIAGHRRTDALRAAGISTARALVWPVATPEDQLDKLTFVENYHRKQLSTAETAKALQLLMEKYGKDLREAAEFLGVSVGHAHNLTKVLDASPAVFELVEEGKLGANAGSKLAKLAEEEQVVAATAIKQGKPVAETLEEIKGGTLKPTDAEKKKKVSSKTSNGKSEPKEDKKTEEIEASVALQALTNGRPGPLVKACEKANPGKEISLEECLLIALVRLGAGNVKWAKAIEIHEQMLRADKRALKSVLTAFEAVLGIKEFSDDSRWKLLAETLSAASKLIAGSEVE